MGQIVLFPGLAYVESFDVERLRTDLAARVCRMDPTRLVALENALDEIDRNAERATGSEVDPEPSQLLFLPVSTIV